MKNIIISFALLSLGLLMSCGEGVQPVNEAPDSRSCQSTHDLVDQTRALRVSNLYGISGNIRIVSDCEIEISDFFYNGSGPNVSLYGGTNGCLLYTSPSPRDRG